MTAAKDHTAAADGEAAGAAARTRQGSPRGETLARAAEQVIPGGVNSTTRYVGEPYAFGRADGAYVTDLDGRRYCDYHAAFGAMLLGHNHPVVNQAVRDQLEGLDLMGLGVGEAEVALATKVVEVLPAAEMMIATMSGSEAVGQAIRLSRAVTGRPMVVKVQGGFHGTYDAIARNVISPPGKAYEMDPLSKGILPEALNNTAIAEFNDLDSVRALFDRYPDRVACVITEPIPHNVGALVPVDGFLHDLQALCTERGSLLILDEVITGFRHALGGYQSVCGVTPDLTTFGKGMANGVPIGGLAGRRDLMAHFDGRTGDVMMAGTFNGYPLGSAAALAVINHLQAQPDFYTRTHALGQRMRDGLGALVEEFDIKARVTGFGGVFVVYFLDEDPLGYRNLLHNDNEAYATFHRRMTEAGHLMLPMALKRNHISGAHTADDIEATLEAARTVLRGMKDEAIV